MAARQSPRRSGAGTAGTAGSAEAVADRLHSAAIHLLRRLRRQDDAGGLSAPRLSALSVVVAVGPIAVGELAAAEQVRVPTISRLVDALEEDGLVRRVPDPGDRRIVRVEATAAGRALLHAGRRRRIAALAKDIGGLSAKERKALIGVIPLLERLAGS